MLRVCPHLELHGDATAEGCGRASDQGEQRYRAVSAYPFVRDGHPAAEVTLFQADAMKKVWVKLD